MKRYLKLSRVAVLLFLLAGCSHPYKELQIQDNSSYTSAFKYKPVFDKVLYRCVVDGGYIFKKFHLSGILLFKTLENGTKRAVFQNEMGFTLFDFEWRDSSFNVQQIAPQLDKPAVVKTLRKDMEMLLMTGMDQETEKFFERDRGKTVYHRLTIEKGYIWYVEEHGKLVRIENSGEKKKVTTIHITGKTDAKAMPETVLIDHHKANFTIQLNKIEAYADE